MALKYGFFDSLNGDRKYSASDFGDLFTGLISEGVYQGVLDEFDVTTIEGGGLATHYVIGTGRAWLDGKWISNDSTVQFKIDHSIDNDTDEYIFIVVDNRLAYRQIRFEVLRTLPTNTPSVKYYMIAQTKINLTGSVNITKKVGTSTLPYVSGLVSTYSIDQHADNWEAAWNTYIQAKITETDDIVANLETNLTDNWTAWMISLRDELKDDLDVYINGESNRQNKQDANIEILQRQFANYLDRLDSLEQTGIPNAIEYIEPWIAELQRYKQSNDARVDALETTVNNNTVEFGADISELQIKTQNIPVDGSFNPNVQDVTIPSDDRLTWLSMPSGLYYVGQGQSLGYPSNYILITHNRRNNIYASQQYNSGSKLYQRILNGLETSIQWYGYNNEVADKYTQLGHPNEARNGGTRTHHCPPTNFNNPSDIAKLPSNVPMWLAGSNLTSSVNLPISASAFVEVVNIDDTFYHLEFRPADRNLPNYRGKIANTGNSMVWHLELDDRGKGIYHRAYVGNNGGYSAIFGQNDLAPWGVGSFLVYYTVHNNSANNAAVIGGGFAIFATNGTGEISKTIAIDSDATKFQVVTQAGGKALEFWNRSGAYAVCCLNVIKFRIV